MIPLFKLAKLPKTLKLRKTASFIAAMERKIILVGEITAGETEYINALLKLLLEEYVCLDGYLRVSFDVLNPRPLFE